MSLVFKSSTGSRCTENAWALNLLAVLGKLDAEKVDVAAEGAAVAAAASEAAADFEIGVTRRSGGQLEGDRPSAPISGSSSRICHRAFPGRY